MSDQTEYNLDDDTASQLPDNARKYMRGLEAKLKEYEPLKAENDRFKLKEDLRTAGMDFSDKQLKALLASHEGESTPEELRKTAEELKFVDPIPAKDAADEQAHGAIDAAREGANGTGANKQVSYEEAVKGTKNMQELQKVAAEYGRNVLERQG